MQILQPEGWPRPKGYSNGIAVFGRQVFVAGQIGWTKEAKLVEGGMAPQFAQAMQNVVDVLTEAGGRPEHVGRLTIYVTDKRAYLAATKEIGAAYRACFGKHYPAMALVQVADLLEDGAMVEIEATAVIPEETR